MDRINLLLVEDNEDDYAIALHTLGKVPEVAYDVTWVRSSTEGVKHLLSNSFDVCLLDNRVQGGTAVDFFRSIHSQGVSIPIIVLTGESEKGIDFELIQLGASDYLEKNSITSQLLHRSIRYAMERRRGEVALGIAEGRSNFFQKLIDQTNDTIMVISPQTELFVYVNDQACSNLQYSREAILGMRGNQITSDPRNVLSREHIAEIISKQGVICETFFQRKDGTVYPVEINIRVVGQEPLQYLVVIGRDVSERRQLQERLSNMQRLESVGKLAGGVAHDFNNLLTIMHGHLGFVSTFPLPSEVVDHLSQLTLTLDRAANLTRQLLSFGRRQFLNPKTIELEKVIANTLKMISRILGEDVRLSFQLESSDLKVDVDPSLIEQIIVNLVTNARDAMPQGGTLTISIQSRRIEDAFVKKYPEARTGTFACIRVEDTGKGISAESLPRLFEPFFTTKDIAKGSGLGLASIYGLTLQHGGFITVESTLGQGTVFEVYLPMSKQNLNSPVKTAPVLARARGELILVAEDEFLLRDLLQKILESHGYRVLAAATGPEALGLWLEHGKDVQLLLTDIIMPGGITGLELAERILLDRPDLSILYTSGYSPEVVGKGILRKGINFLAKPYTSEQLLTQVSVCLGYQV
ncbi:MAG: multi-sensor hybrid histidine kinase [Verrucomicrobiales bacterium]|nr:multi-sensor hybrid histidine kinase [Verrucomicrobiales bacterium]